MNILDRYVLKNFVMTLFFSILSLVVIFIIVSLLEKLDKFLDRNASTDVIIDYYIHYIPEILKLLTPIATLLATLFSIGRLSNTNEITAMKSGGMSIYRLMTPLVFVGVLLSFMQLYFNGWVVPESNIIKNEISSKYIKRGMKSASIHNLYFRDTPQRNLIINYYNSTRKSGTGVAIETFSNEKKPRLSKRIEAKTITWNDSLNQWDLIAVIERDYSTENFNTSYYDTLTANLNMNHDQLMRLKKIEDEMTFDEMKQYIDLLDNGGKDIRKQLVAYYGEIAFPFANIIVILFAVPFSSVRKKGGIAIQIAAAMVISFSYLIFTKIGQAIGLSSNFDPILSAWLANIVFFLASLIIIFRSRT